MIPYIEWKEFMIGPITVHVWGVLVALGFLFGARMGAYFAKKQGLKAEVMYDLVVWMMVAAIVGGRLGYVLWYNPSYFLAHPMEVFSVWDGGMSLFGGLITAIVLGIWYLKKKGLPVWKYADVTFFSVPFGLWIGRMGCFLIHDHPGTATDFFLGVAYPDGVIRHDHGLYLSLNGFILGLLFLWLSRKQRPVGFYAGTFMVWYGAVRFFLDFYRIADVRYAHMTPGQYIGILFAITGVALLIYLIRNPKRFGSYE